MVFEVVEVLVVMVVLLSGISTNFTVPVSIRRGLYGALFLTRSSTRSARTIGLSASCLYLWFNTLLKDTCILPGLNFSTFVLI